MKFGVLMITAVIGAKDCWAWGATGHEWISGIAIEKLPDSVPASYAHLRPPPTSQYSAASSTAPRVRAERTMPSGTPATKWTWPTTGT